jgi:hypothetical protein
VSFLPILLGQMALNGKRPEGQVSTINKIGKEARIRKKWGKIYV